MVAISERGKKLAMLDQMKATEEKTEARLIEIMREKQRELHRIQKEQKALATRLLTCQRQIAAITDEMGNLIARKTA